MSPEVEAIETTAALEALQPAWRALWDRVPEATPFQAPAWLVPWWRVFGADGGLLALAVRCAGRLVGLAPLYGYYAEGTRTLLPVGIGVSDHLDPLFEPGYARDGAAAVLGWLARYRHRFDRIDLPCQRPGSPFLDAAPPAGWRTERHAGEPCVVLDLAARAAQGRGPFTSRRASRLRQYRRRAEAIGPVAFEIGTAAALDGLLTALFALHEARWRERGGPGVLADPAVRAFHRMAAPRLLACGHLRLVGLRIGGRLAGVFLALTDRRRLHVYIGGFDPGMAAFSPGAMMIGHLIAQAAGEGRQEVDFLRGREAYKYEWGAVDRASWTRTLTPGRAAGLEPP